MKLEKRFSVAITWDAGQMLIAFKDVPAVDFDASPSPPVPSWLESVLLSAYVAGYETAVLNLRRELKA